MPYPAIGCRPGAASATRSQGSHAFHVWDASNFRHRIKPEQGMEFALVNNEDVASDGKR